MSDILSKNIKKEPAAAEHALEYIISYIRAAGLKPGDPLPGELDFVSKTGVGRSSVREAMSALRTLGVIESRKKGGARIRRDPALLEMRVFFSGDYSDPELCGEIMEFRAALEWGLGEKIFHTVTAAQLRKMRAVTEDIRLNGEGSTDLNSADKIFHSELVRGCRNKPAELLTSLYTPVFDRLRSLVPGGRHAKSVVKRWAEQHSEIAGALEKKDKALFLELLHEHTRRYIKLRVKS